MSEFKFMVRCMKCGELIEINSETIGMSEWLEIGITDDKKISIECVMCNNQVIFKGEDNNE